jgi:hypothetical protein
MARAGAGWKAGLAADPSPALPPPRAVGAHSDATCTMRKTRFQTKL